jgi:LysM repeat protein
MYRKVMEVEGEIRRHAERYGVDFDLARAVCLYESGGNAGLASQAGAQGYFQVMPATYRELKVATNIEAGVKYLAQMIQQFGREDRAVAAYNGGPGRVGRAGGLPLETLQYVVGVGHYRTVLKQYDEPLRYHASRLSLASVQTGDDWSTLSSRLRISDWELRLHNPFLAGRRLRTGERVAYPPEPRRDLLTPIEGGAAYRMRHGDNYIKLAIMLGLEIEALRAENGLWQTQAVPAGVVLRIPLSIDRSNIIKASLTDRGLGPFTPPPPALLNAAVSRGDAAEPTGAALIPQPPAAGTEAVPVTPPAPVTTASRAAGGSTPHAAATIVHRVKRGDTLTSLAQRYGTTIAAIQRVNGLRRTTIQIGQSLRIPRAHANEANDSAGRANG